MNATAWAKRQLKAELKEVLSLGYACNAVDWKGGRFKLFAARRMEAARLLRLAISAIQNAKPPTSHPPKQKGTPE